MDKLAYLAKRLLLAIPTFIGITAVCFALTRFLPGGPVEMRMMRTKGLAAQSAGGVAPSQSAGAAGIGGVSEEYRRQLERQFGFDKPLVRQYWDWLVVNRMGMKLPSYDFPGKTAWELIRSRIPVSPPPDVRLGVVACGVRCVCDSDVCAGYAVQDRVLRHG